MKIFATVLGTGLLLAGTALPQNQVIPGERTVQVSEHLWTIMGWSNTGIVVGRNATLVVDAGLGPRHGATIAKVAKNRAPPNTLYLTKFDFHPKHSSGEPGFPAGTILIRDKVQQDEMDAHGVEMIDRFAERSEQQKELLAKIKLRPPDETFDRGRVLEPGGGVKARLPWFRGAHTKRGEHTFVEPDKTLTSGDTVQNKVVRNIYGAGDRPASWIAVLDRLAGLGVLPVLPDHSAMGDGSLISQETAFITDLRMRALDLNRQATSADDADADKQLTAEFKTKYPDWPITSVAGFVKGVYAE